MHFLAFIALFFYLTKAQDIFGFDNADDVFGSPMLGEDPFESSSHNNDSQDQQAIKNDNVFGSGDGVDEPQKTVTRTVYATATVEKLLTVTTISTVVSMRTITMPPVTISKTEIDTAYANSNDMADWY